MDIKDILKVMVIDDHVTSRMLTVETLQQLGVKHIRIAKDGKDAFDKLNAEPVHLVLSDLYMPGVDGLQLLKVLRSHTRFAKIGYIIITGKKDANVVAKAKELGVNNVLSKPFSAPVLKQAVEAVVGRLG